MRTRHSLGLIAVVAFALVLVSCSGEAPSIVSIRWSHVLRDPAGPPPSECLSIFVAASDADGKDDVEALTLAHDESQLVWKLDKDSWTEKIEGETIWLGSNALSMAEGGALPRGRYRIILRDAAGESDEASFTLNDPGKRQAASLRLDGSSVIVQAPYAASTFVVLDASGATLASVPASRGRTELQSVLSTTQAGLAKGLMLISLDESANVAVQSPVVALP